MSTLFCTAKIASAVVLLLTVLPLAADWQFTRWGMSQTELQASGGIEIVGLGAQEVQTRQMPNGTPRFKMRHQAGKYTFDVYFLFGRGLTGPENPDGTEGLTQIRMELKSGPSCEALYSELCGKYGDQAFLQRLGRSTITASWKDRVNKNEVTLINSASCTVVYTPLVDAREGL